jgi:hypothetical protein
MACPPPIISTDRGSLDPGFMSIWGYIRTVLSLLAMLHITSSVIVGFKILFKILFYNMD